MFRDLEAIFDILITKKERHHVVWLFLGVLVMGVMEIAGIASVMPFLAVVINPEAIETNRYLNFVYSAFDFQGVEHFLFWIGFGVLGLLVFNCTVSAVIMWLLLRFSNMRGHVLSQRLLTTYLSQPYVYFLNRNGANLVKKIIEDVNRFVGGVAIPLVGTFVKGVSVICITGLLVAVDPLMALIVIAVLGGAYGALFLVIRRKLAKIGNESFDARAERFKIASESIGGVKDLKVLGREGDQVRRFSVPSMAFARQEAANQALGILPRYVLETIAFGGILLVVLFLVSAGGTASSIIPVLSLYAFAGYRLIPAVQTIFASVANIRYYRSVIETLLQDMTILQGASSFERGRESLVPIFPASLVELNRVKFSYSGTKHPVFDGLNLRIQANTTVGVVGPTGSGKTTLIDILLGLLVPDCGHLAVDGIEITSANVGCWQKSVGYVSQQVYLSDATIASNIAFGVPESEIDHGAVERAARIAKLHDWVTDLPREYGTVVGDHGVRLSGGQRQRIAIARALYNDAPVVILDEATSAVDGETEYGIMDAIHALSNKTLILIAHRLSTVKQCDIIYILDDGEIVGQGTYAELMEKNSQFRRMANVT